MPSTDACPRFYTCLEIPSNAGRESIATAYRRLSLIYHPLRAEPTRQAEFLKTFTALAESYEVLSKPEARQLYDQYGEQALREGITEGENQVGPFFFNGDAFATFQGVFGSANPWTCDTSISYPIDAEVAALA